MSDGDKDDHSRVLHKIERRLAVIAICLIVIAISSVIAIWIAWETLSAIQERLNERRQAELPHAVIPGVTGFGTGNTG